MVLSLFIATCSSSSTLAFASSCAMDQWHRPSAGYLTLCTSVSWTGVFVPKLMHKSKGIWSVIPLSVFVILVNLCAFLMIAKLMQWFTYTSSSLMLFFYCCHQGKLCSWYIILYSSACMTCASYNRTLCFSIIIHNTSKESCMSTSILSPYLPLPR